MQGLHGRVSVQSRIVRGLEIYRQDISKGIKLIDNNIAKNRQMDSGTSPE
jgi:hypothetical protein